MNYRRDWSAIEGSPRTVALNGDFRLTPTMHLGADIFADFADIFTVCVPESIMASAWKWAWSNT